MSHHKFDLSWRSDEDDHDSALVLFLKAFEDARKSKKPFTFEVWIPSPESQEESVPRQSHLPFAAHAALGERDLKAS